MIHSLVKLRSTLCECGLVPGALMRNAGQRYICKQVHLRTKTADSPFTHCTPSGTVLRMQIGHMEGNYFYDEPTLRDTDDAPRAAGQHKGDQSSAPVTVGNSTAGFASPHCACSFLRLLSEEPTEPLTLESPHSRCGRSGRGEELPH